MAADLDTLARRFRPPDPRPDAELLARFADAADGGAFAELVARHGPMVLGACRRVLGNPADADDAFQAAFVVLARRAGVAARAQSPAGWLYGVAVRVARKARVRDARRKARERRATPVNAADRLDPAEWADLRAVLDDELERLGDRYRDPLVLCCLEGRSREEAARLLGWPEGTVSGRLARAKELLRGRLERRGVACSAPVLATVLAERGTAAVPPALARAALDAVTGAVPAGVAELTAGAAPLRWGRWAVGGLAGVSVVAAGLVAAGLREPPAPVPEVAKADDGSVRLAHGAEVLAVAAGSGGRVATAGGGPDVRVWNADGPAVARCPVPGGAGAVTFSPDGRRLAAACHDGFVRVFDPATGALLHTLDGHGEAAHAAAFSPDGATLVTAGADGTVRVWEAATGRHLRDLDGHRGRVWGVAVSPEGTEIASGSGDGFVRTWDSTTGRMKRAVPGLRGGAYAVEYAPAGDALTVAADNTVLRLDPRTGRELARVGGPRTAVTWFALSPDGRTLAYRDGKTVRVWEVAASADRLTVEVGAEPSALAFTPDGRSLVVAAADGATVYDVARLVRPLPTADGNALWAALSGPDPAPAYRAVVSLAAAPDRAVPLLRDRLHAWPDLDARVGGLVRQLGADDFTDRERAGKELEAIGPDAGPALRRAATDPSPEVVRRAARLLAKLPAEDRPSLAQGRAVEALERMATPDARAALAALVGRERDSPVKHEAAAALKRLGRPKP